MGYMRHDTVIVVVSGYVHDKLPKGHKGRHKA